MNPIFKSPMVDYGYDISDYYSIDPIFGDMDDFDEMLKKLKDLGIRLLLDFVPGHTSSENEWFLKSVRREDPYTDYYVWADGKINIITGERGPPNNWLSIFNGPAWTWNEERQQYYLHQFAVTQPKLNLRNPAVRNEMKNVLKYWFDKGVNGFRVDAVSFLIEDDQLRDEPLSGLPGFQPNEYFYLQEIYVKDLPENVEVLQEFHSYITEYSFNTDNKTRILVAESFTDIPKSVLYYGTEDRPAADIAFNFGFNRQLQKDFTAYDLEDSIIRFLTNLPKGKWPNWLTASHDTPRATTKFGPELADALNALIMLLPGTVCTYYGEEIGMENVFISYEDTVDTMGRNSGPNRYQLFTRDPTKTPLPWDDSLNGGFSTANKTWLPVARNYKTSNVHQQTVTWPSHLHVYKKLVALRNNKTLQEGSLTTRAISSDIFAFTRDLPGHDSVVVVINLAPNIQVVNLRKHFDQLPQALKVYVASINYADAGLSGGRKVLTESVPVPARGVVVLSTEN